MSTKEFCDYCHAEKPIRPVCLFDSSKQGIGEYGSLLSIGDLCDNCLDDLRGVVGNWSKGKL